MRIENSTSSNKALSLEEKAGLAHKHLLAVLEVNQNLNLTRIENLNEGLIFHIEDSLTALETVDKAQEGLMADIGSGAGYPGIPLAIYSGRNTFLIESIKKKADFLNAVIKSLGLENQIFVVNKRAEDIAKEGNHKFSVVTARAVGELPTIMELAAPLLEIGGTFIAFKGRPEKIEIERGEQVAEQLGMQQESITRITLSDDKSQRVLLTYKKVAEPRINLPRRAGMAKKRPLC